MKTYFITGGEGFIGYHLCKKLLENQNNKVITYDAHKHYISLDKSKWMKYLMYRKKSLQNKNLLRIQGDATDRVFLKEKLEEFEPEFIIHLSSLPIASVSNKYPEEAKRNILDSTITILDILREHTFKFNRFVYTSSSMVYGNFLKDEKGNIIPAKEDQKCDPVGLYGAMKLSGEIIARAYNRRFGIPYTIVRPSAVYGPTDCNKRVTELFLLSALNGKALILENGGMQKLDFTYVEDTVQGFIKILHSDRATNEIFNITKGVGRTIKELTDIISELIPSTKTVVKEIDSFRPTRGTLDITKARNQVGYKPIYSLEKGIKEYLDFIRRAEYESM